MLDRMLTKTESHSLEEIELSEEGVVPSMIVEYSREGNVVVEGY